MPATEAQIRANRINATRSTGPRTEEGKAISRGNAVTHGLTASKVLPESEAAEVKLRIESFTIELNPTGEVARALVERAATLSVRMERCVKYENAALATRVRQAEADFVAPDGVDPTEAAKLRNEAGQLALFDTSREAILARKYEAAAERGFFRALKELRQLERSEKAAGSNVAPPPMTEELASLSLVKKELAELEACKPKPTHPAPRMTSIPALPTDFPAFGVGANVPFAIGKTR